MAPNPPQSAPTGSKSTAPSKNKVPKDGAEPMNIGSTSTGNINWDNANFAPPSEPGSKPPSRSSSGDKQPVRQDSDTAGKRSAKNPPSEIKSRPFKDMITLIKANGVLGISHKEKDTDIIIHLGKSDDKFAAMLVGTANPKKHTEILISDESPSPNEAMYNLAVKADKRYETIMTLKKYDLTTMMKKKKKSDPAHVNND